MAPLLMPQTDAPPDHGTPERVVLLVGATGFVGAEVAAALRAHGYRITAVLRRAGEASAKRIVADRIVEMDLREATSPARWENALSGVDAVVYCAGVLQEGGRDAVAAVQLQAPAALCDACSKASVKRLIYFSAMNAGNSGLTVFSQTKHEMEQRLEASPLDYVILRPSVIVGQSAYGGSALFRGLASLPWLPRLSGAGPLSIVQMEDVVATVLFFLKPGAAGRLALDLAGPEALTFEDVVARFRVWLGHAPPRLIDWPAIVLRFGAWAGDIAGALGWRPPLRTTGLAELTRGAKGDPAQWTAVTGIQPVSLGTSLERRPASAQERWFSNLYFLRPLGLLIFSGFFLLTGIVALGPGFDIGVTMMQAGGAGPLSAPSVIAGALADIVVAVGVLWRRTTRLALQAAIALTAFYVVAGTLILPELWRDPLGPMMKVWPIFALNFILLAILEER